MLRMLLLIRSQKYLEATVKHKLIRYNTKTKDQALTVTGQSLFVSYEISSLQLIGNIIFI